MSPQAFVGAFGRRVEAQCRSDWTALPIMRNVAFKWVAEHTMSTATAFIGNPGEAMRTSTKELVAALQNLYHKLHNGFIGQGPTRVPIAGDTTKLHLAAGLTKLEKYLARASHFLAQHLPGTSPQFQPCEERVYPHPFAKTSTISNGSI